MADAKKLLGGLGKVGQRLLASDKELTAAERAEAGRKAAALIQSQPQVKPSEALGQLMETGVKRTTTTQADRTRVGGGNIGGASFPAISEADPAYAGRVWGVMDEGTAARLKNLTAPDTAWTTMLGSANQLKTNPIVFDKLKRGFQASMKEGKLSPELANKINHNLALTFGEGADIRDPKIWKQADTFEKRAALADVMMGQGIAPGKGGVAIGGEKSGKGVIFRPTDILKRETEPSLLHTEHGGDVPTFAAGPRLFRIERESEFRPDLHPGFPTLLTGKDYGINMKPTPTEVYLPDWHSRFKKNNPERKGPGYYDLALGVKGEGLPSQDLNDEYIRHLLREGFKDGGEVDMDAADARLTKAIEARMSGNGMAKGGEVDIEAADARLADAIASRNGMAGGGKAEAIKGAGKVFKRLFAEPAAETKIIQAPSVIIPSKLSNVKEAVRQSKGDFGARRVERAADEIPNLERMYKEEGLRSAFVGDNAQAVMTMKPGDFEKFAKQLEGRTSADIGPKMAELAKKGEIDKYTLPTDEYVQYLQGLRGGFDDVPFLGIDKEEYGLPLKPFISGHEGRHRSRALAESGQPTSLVRLIPRAELREPFPRRSQEEYLDALRQELDLTGNLVLPEGRSGSPIVLPDIYAEGGDVHMADGGKAGAVKGALNIGKRLFADAPQAKALKLAQERAALPPAEGGLGLPKNNTPEQRARAMGFDRDTYHGSFRDIKKLDPRSGSTESHAGKGIYSTDSPKDASRNYASIYGPDVSGRVERGLEVRDKDFRKIHGRMRDETLTPRQQDILLRNTVDADNLGVVYPLKVRSDSSIHLDAPEANPVRIGPFERYDEATDTYVDTPQTPRLNEALDEFRELGGDANPVYEIVQDYGDAIPARDVFNAVKKTGNESGLYDSFTGDIVSGGVAAGDFVKHFGIDEIRHTPQFMNRELNIGKEHTISLNPDNVRSRFAAFDPFRRSAATAATMGVAAPDLLAKEAKDAKEKKKAQGGLAMADGGKAGAVKGALSLGKRLFAERPALPAAEREANLAKFLEPSKTPMRLYHGTTATEGGKGTEAIRRIKPSKEGALGSGTYLTPKPNFAGEYASEMGGNMLPVHAQVRNPLVIEGTGDPMIEALTKLGVDPERATRMVERAYDQKGYIGKEVETRARAAGYDGLMQYRNGELNEVVTYNPNAVKSAIGNEGTYDTSVPDLSKAEGGAAFKKLQFMAGGGITTSGGTFTPEDLGVTSAELNAPVISKDRMSQIRRNAAELWGEGKEQLEKEYRQLSRPGGKKDFAIRVGSQLLGGVPDLINLGLEGVDLVQSAIPGLGKPASVLDTEGTGDRIPKFRLASDEPWLGSQLFMRKFKEAELLGKNEFPLTELAAGFASPAIAAGAIKGGKKAVKAVADTQKKRRGGLTAMTR